MSERSPVQAAPEEQSTRPGEGVESRWRVAGCFILLLVGLQLTAGPAIRLGMWRADAGFNPAIMEAESWRNGRLDLPERLWDTAIHEGKYYNVYPPLFTFLSLAATWLGGFQGVPEGVFFSPWFVAVVALPLPFVGFWVFQQVVGKAAWSAVLTGYWLIGTPMLPLLGDCIVGDINAINQVLASIGLMLLAGDLLGRKRIWPAAIGLLIGAWSRQLTIFYGLPVLWVAWSAAEHRRRKFVTALVALTLASGTLMSLNWLKFGNPLDTGYRKIYEGGREDQWYGVRAAEHGLFSVRFISENAYYMNLSPPRFRLSKDLVPVVEHDKHGVSIWITTPILLCLVVGAGRWLRDGAAVALVAASAVVILGFLMYHNPGTPQVGYFRFAMDFVPIWLVVLAPWVAEVRRRPVLLACFAWSALYFHLLPYRIG